MCHGSHDVAAAARTVPPLIQHACTSVARLPRMRAGRAPLSAHQTNEATGAEQSSTIRCTLPLRPAVCVHAWLGFSIVGRKIQRTHR